MIYKNILLFFFFFYTFGLVGHRGLCPVKLVHEINIWVVLQPPTMITTLQLHIWRWSDPFGIFYLLQLYAIIPFESYYSFSILIFLQLYYKPFHDHTLFSNLDAWFDMRKVHIHHPPLSLKWSTKSSADQISVIGFVIKACPQVAFSLCTTLRLCLDFSFF